MSTNAIVRLEKPQIGPAAEMLSRAYENDPKMAHVIRDAAKRHASSRDILEFEIKYGMRYGEVHVTSPALEGVAIWLPSAKAQMTFWRSVLVGGIKLHHEIGTEALNTIEDFGRQIDAIRTRHLPAPHWYLITIGVDPAFQGKGFADRLVLPMLARLDAEGTPSYVDVQNEKYVPLYRHYGYEVVEQTTIAGTDVGYWGMVRKAPGK